MLVYIPVPATWWLTDFALHYGMGVNKLNTEPLYRAAKVRYS